MQGLRILRSEAYFADVGMTENEYNALDEHFTKA